jgi:hypothetical protein
MSEAFLRVAVVWADPDLLDLEVVVRFQEWSGITRAYVSRSEVRAFAADLDAVVAGGTEARFLGGQRNLGYAEFSLREYTGVRRLAIDLVIGNAYGGGPGSGSQELRISVPIEHGALPRFADALRAVVKRERGEATLALLQRWP